MRAHTSLRIFAMAFIRDISLLLSCLSVWLLTSQNKLGNVASSSVFGRVWEELVLLIFLKYWIEFTDKIFSVKPFFFFCREIFLKNNLFLAGWVFVAVRAFL